MNVIKAILPVTILLFACGSGGSHKSTNHQELELKMEKPESISEAVNDSTMVYLESDDGSPYNPMSSSAAYNIGDSTRKFIKTADLKFRVSSVIRATYEIEDLTRNFGGFVTQTRLDSRIDQTTVIPVSPDSALETVYYTVINTMTIRVPEKKLDSTLRSFTPQVEYLDHRTIDVQDVYLQLLANQLTQQRVKNQQDRVKKNIDGKGKDLGTMNEAEDMLYRRQEMADNAKIESLLLKDKMEFSTVTLYIYQRQAIKRELIFNSKNIEGYEPRFGYKLKHSFINGWKAVQAIVLFFAQFWVLILFGLIVATIFKVARIKFK